MRCPRCRSPMVKGRIVGTPRRVWACNACGRIYELDYRRGGYKQVWLRQRPEYLVLDDGW